MALKLMGRKRGMTQMFDNKGNLVVCTVIHAEPNVVTQIKTSQTDGYSAIQLAYDAVKVNDERTIAKRVAKPLIGHYKKAGVQPRRHLCETPVENTEEYQLGQEISVSVFADITYVDATAFSKGKGYQGVMKLHGFSGGPASHGSGFHRHAGSCGMRSTPGRVLPGVPKASHMGDRKTTVQNLEIIAINEEDHLIIVKGQIPGAKNSLVIVNVAKKKQAKKKR